MKSVEHWWNDDWQEKMKYSEKNCNPVFLCPSKLMYNLGIEEPMTNCMSYGVVSRSLVRQ
jgi:hypothetical protein